MRSRLIALLVGVILLLPILAAAQRTDDEGVDPRYPADTLERYWECKERNDLDHIKELLYYHHNVEKIDASIYGLPERDFDDRSLLTINERLQHRQNKANRREVSRSEPQMATSGPVQYPHHLRQAYDNMYVVTGERPDCSAILEGQDFEPGDIESLENGWGSDLNLTPGDSVDRGEVDIAIDFANPNRIMASSCPGIGAETSNAIVYTDDYGQSWTKTVVGNNSGSTWECDPVSYYQRSTGRVYHSKIGCNTGSCGETYTMMRYSTDNGASWSDCGRPASQADEDRQWHVVDNTPSSACYGNIYVTWHNLNQERVARSTNNCASWSNVTNLTSAYQAITPDINVAADGHIYVVWQHHAGAEFRIAGSSDCGVTWNAPSAKRLTGRNGDWSNSVPAQCQRGVASQPWVDVDRAPSSPFYGRVYVGLAMFNSSCATASGRSCSQWDTSYTDTCNYDFFLMYSDNQGATFSSPVNVTAGDGNMVDHLVGYMRVDEADGSIYLGYHRSRLNPTSASDRQKTHYFVRRSIDGGQSWQTPLQVSTLEGDERLSGESSFERGDYNAVDVLEGVFWPVWIDRRGSGGEEEIVTRKVCSEPAHWSERSPTFTAPPTICNSPGAGTVDVSWAAPDVYWGDGGEDPSSRKYQLWVDGSLVQDNIASTTTSLTHDPGNCNSHDYQVVAVNQCGISKSYQQNSFAATGCCPDNPTSVDVSPDGPLTLCVGTAQVLTANLTGGTAPFTYQWTEDGSPVGGNAATYTANTTGAHLYTCEVTGEGCAAGGVLDSVSTEITWEDAPAFSGIASAVNGSVDNPCTINLAWNEATTVCAGPVSYRVYRDETTPVTVDAAHRVATGVACSGSPCTFVDTDALVSGTTYHYLVRAFDQSTGVEDDNVVEAMAVPTGTTAQVLFDDFEGVNIGWIFSLGSPAAATGDFLIGDPVGTIGNNGGDSQPEDDHTPAPGVNCLFTAQNPAAGAGVDDIDAGEVVATSPVFDGSGYASLHLSLWRWFFNETANNDAGDYYYLEVSNNGGSSWTELENIPDSRGSLDNQWTNVQFDLESFVSLTSTMRIRARAADGVAAGDLVELAIDDIEITGYVQCTTGSSCTDPTKPVITGITDDDSCAQDGVTITFAGDGSPVSHDLWVDGTQELVGIASPVSYDPQDGDPHSYVIRSVDGSCSTDSDAVGATDLDNSVGTPAPPAVSDLDACNLTGVQVSWSDIGATTYDLSVDGGVVQTSIVGLSTTFNPADSASYNYRVRGVNACGSGAWSEPTSASDVNGIPAPDAPTVTDSSNCALSGVQVSWNDVGATTYDLYVDGSPVETGIVGTSTSYSPGDGNSHNYRVLGNSAGCSSPLSPQTSASDGDHSISWSGIDSAADRDACDDTGVALRWSAPGNWNDGGVGARTFNVLRDGSPLFTGLGESVLAAEDTTGTNGQPYAYGVEAVNDYGCTAGAASTIQATDEIGLPPSFDDGSVTVETMSGEACGLRLDWAAGTSNCINGPAVVYNVYRSEASDFTPNAATNLLASCVTNLYYEDHTVLSGVDYYYVTRAEDSSVGHGGPCGGGIEEANTARVTGTVPLTVETADQDGAADPFQVSSNTLDVDLLPAFPLSSADSASLSYTLTHSGAADQDVLTTPGFTGSGGNTWDRKTLTPDATIATPSTSASFTYTVTANFGSMSSPRLYFNDNTNGPFVALNSPTGNNIPVVTTAAVKTFYDTYGPGTYYFVVYTISGGPNRSVFANISMTIDGAGGGDVRTCTQVALVDPSDAENILKLDGAIDANPYDVTAYYTGPGTYRVRLTEDCGSTATLTGARMTASAATCTTVADPLEHFAARSTDSEVKLEWQNPNNGAYSSTRICWSDVAFPTDPATCTVLVERGVPAVSNGDYDTFSHTGRTNGQVYYYAAFVDTGTGEFSPSKTVMARPFDSNSGRTKWAYHSAATSLAPPGLREGGIGTGAAYAVSNDRVLHGMQPTTLGGDWPRQSPFSWMPMGMNGPAQERPPVVPTTVVDVGGDGTPDTDLVVFLGSHDGYVYAADARTGATLWQSEYFFTLVQGAPAGVFTAFAGDYDLLFAGSRVGGSDNTMVGIDPVDGGTAWTFGGGIGTISSSATVDYASNRLFFASRENPSGSSNTVWCLSFTDSTVSPLWAVGLGDIDGAPILFDGILYVGTNAGAVYALDATNGDVIWSYQTGDGPVKGYVYPEFAALPRRLFFATTNSLWAIVHKADGTVSDLGGDGAWSQAFNANGYGRPSIPLTLDDWGLMFVGSTDGSLYQIDLGDGTVFLPPVVMGDGGATVGSPGYDWRNSMAYVGSEDGTVYAVELPLTP